MEIILDLSDLFLILNVIFVLEFSIHTVFTGVSYDIPGYESSLVTMLEQICTGQRCLPVRYWVTVVFLTPFLCVQNIENTLSARRI